MLNSSVIFLTLLLIGLAIPSIVQGVLYHVVDGSLESSVEVFNHPPPNGPPPREEAPFGLLGNPNGPSPNFRDPNRQNVPLRAQTSPEFGLGLKLGNSKGSLQFSLINNSTYLGHVAYDPTSAKEILKKKPGELIFSNAFLQGEKIRVLTVRIPAVSVGPDATARLGIRIPPPKDFNSAPGTTPVAPKGPPVHQFIVLQAAQSLNSIGVALNSLRLALVWLLPISLLFAVVGGVAIAKLMFGQVGKLAQAAEKIQATSLNERLPSLNQDELGDLAKSFNSLLDRVERSYIAQQDALENQKKFTANASHELRTPLTVIKGRASSALDLLPENSPLQDTLHSIDSAADSMTELVSNLLFLSRLDSNPTSLANEPILIPNILDEVQKRVPANQVKRLKIIVESGSESLAAMGQKDDLIRAILNLVMNGLYYSAVEKQVVLKLSSNGSWSKIEIIDEGQGIPTNALPRLGDRFYRVDDARTRRDGGSGLGISIAKAIVLSIGGTLDFQSELGKGTIATVSLPSPQ